MVERNWIRLRVDGALRRNLVLRAKILSASRAFFDEQGFVEIDPPALVPLPGMEPHLDPFSTMLRGPGGHQRRFYLHTSPEYCLKKLLSAGMERLYALGHAFRNGELSACHNPEFALLEWYRAHEDYRALMEDCERLLLRLSGTAGKGPRIRYGGVDLDLTPPWPRISVREAVLEHAGLDLDRVDSLEALVAAAKGKGYTEVSEAWPWEDVFYRIFLQEVEPRLPSGRPYFLVDYPVEMAALARRKPGEARWVERFELYAGGLELANAFSELTDPEQQRDRLVRERAQRAGLGRELYPIDTTFLEALERGMPEAAGIALGVDRVVMLMADASSIREVLAFPAEDLLEEWMRVGRPREGS